MFEKRRSFFWKLCKYLDVNELSLKLKKCPLCGSTAMFDILDYDFDTNLHSGVRVLCSNSSCSQQSDWSSSSGYWASIDLAIQQWNKNNRSF